MNKKIDESDSIIAEYEYVYPLLEFPGYKFWMFSSLGSGLTKGEASKAYGELPAIIRAGMSVFVILAAISLLAQIVAWALALTQ